MSAARKALRPELSRTVPVADVGEAPLEVTVVADEGERKALARRFGLIAIESLSGAVTVERTEARDGSGPVIRVTLGFAAKVTQRCVVSLEPVEAAVSEQGLVVEFALDLEAGPRPGEEVVLSLEDVEPPEPLPGDAIDVGELLAQEVALALDPYPRRPGAQTAAPVEGDTPRPNPFAALERLKGPRRD